MKITLPFAAILAAAAWIAIGQIYAAPPTVRPRVTVKSIPAYSPDGQPAPPIPGAPSMIPGHPLPPPTGPPLAPSLLAWDGEAKEATVTFGAAQASFAFQVSNVSPGPITITSVQSSCGCTVAKLPSIPWTLSPGTQGTIDVVMNLAGKRGINIKNLTVNTDHGFKTLTVRTNIQEPPAGAMNPADRAKNLQIASANRQAVLYGECAACHSDPATNRMGADLYQAACTICHEAAHRADNVPDLKHLQKPTDANYWRTWITSSAQGKLMPAFATEHGGILTPAQIDSLVKYLAESIPSEQPAAPASSTR